ncbi:MAG: MarR family transcriptional regulator [Thermodesulfobacteriota bacterium]|nr:MarR family transcriptional regulator [Thermodesulfobacteriota bacterium]
MTTISIRTGNVDSFFARARKAAVKADRGEDFEDKVTISFENPDEMLLLLSGGRRRIILEVMKRPQTVQELASILNRKQTTIVKEIRYLEQKGLLSRKKVQSREKRSEVFVEAVAPKIELVSMLGA